MEFRNLGKSDLKPSVIGFGAWGISGDLGDINEEKEIIATIKEAYNLGINFFDTAPAYGYEKFGIKGYGKSEELLGKALKGIRNKVIIATKFGVVYGERSFNNSSKIIKKEIEGSLMRLQTDYIDLYQVHWPDQYTRIEETFLTLNELKKSGKIRFIGVCNYGVSFIEEALNYSEVISSQNLYNMIQRNATNIFGNDLPYRTENEVLPYCEQKNIGFIPYSPFCQGLLTGKKLKLDDYNVTDIRKYNNELVGDRLIRNLELVKKLIKIAERIDKPLSQMVLNWLRNDKRISTIIAGPIKIEEVIDNVKSITWVLDKKIYKEINNLIKKV